MERIYLIERNFQGYQWANYRKFPTQKFGISSPGFGSKLWACWVSGPSSGLVVSIPITYMYLKTLYAIRLVQVF